MKPIKTKLSIQIAASSDQKEKTQVDQLPIIGASFSDENTAYIAYGTDVLSFEKLVSAGVRELIRFLLVVFNF